MRVRGADQDRRGGDPGLRLDGFTDLHDRVATDAQRVDADERDSGLAVVEYGGADLARIMHRPVIRLAVAARGFHADLGRDVPLGEAGLEEGAGRLVRARGNPGRYCQQAEDQFPSQVSSYHGACSW